MKVFKSTLSIISGQGEAVVNVYDVHRGSDGFIWLVANNIPNKADAIYKQGTKNSDGFAGASLNFKISHGDSISLTGAWKAGSDEFFRQTGVDVRDTVMGRVVVGKRRGKSDNPYETIIEDVLYQEDMQLGEYPIKRAKEIAQRLADETGEKVYRYYQTLGGSSSGYEEPTKAK